MDHETQLKLLSQRAKLATIASWVVLAFTAAYLLTEIAELAGIMNIEAMPSPLFEIYVVIAFGSIAAFILSVILVSMWIYRAHAGLREAGLEGSQFSPGWAVGWFFVPIANLFMPYAAMKELWNNSTGASDGHTMLNYWWGTWIIGNIANNISTRMSGSESADVYWHSLWVGAIGSILTIICAWLLIWIIKSITSAQRDGLSLAQAFE